MGEAPPRAATSPPGGVLALSPMARQQLDACVHCGFCLPACPTYRLLGEEADSPRGRIDMIAAVDRGEVPRTDPDVERHLERCLDCRACESACPSGVRYHLLFEAAMAAQPVGTSARTVDAAVGGTHGGALPPLPAPLLRLGLRVLVRHSRLLTVAAGAARRWSHAVPGLPATAADLADGLPRPSQPPARRVLPRVLPARGERRGVVDLFLGCVQDACFGGDNVAAARLLQAWGLEVHLRPQETCCGALHAHAGARGDLLELAQRNARAFAGEAPVVVVAAGCSALLREYDRVCAGTPFAAAAASLARRTVDLSAFLAALPVAQRPVPRPLREGAVRLTYHDPCHLSHAQGIRAQPRELLRAIPGVELVEMDEADSCCGSAGFYNLTQPELSQALLRQKVARVQASGAQWLVTANPGCLLQLRAGMRQAGLGVRVASLAEVLAEAYAGAPTAVGERAAAAGQGATG